MKKLLTAAALAAIVGAPAAALADDEGDVKYRQGVMKAIAGHAGAIAQVAKGKADHADHLAGHAHALAELSKYVVAAFKNKAGVGDDSAAKAEVWSDWSGFESKAMDLEKAAMAVADASKSGPDAVKGKLGGLFDACKACHKEYRVKKD